MHQRTFARVGPMRAKTFFYICATIALFLVWRLYDVQVLRGPVLAREALAQRSDTVEVFARRGSLLDRSGVVLVRSLPSQSVFVVPHDVVDADVATAKLETIFGKFDPGLVRTIHDRHAWFAWIARKVPNETAGRVAALDLAGVQLEQEDSGRRVDAAGTTASTVLGFVGTDENGLDGAEYSFDSLLRGRSGKMTLEADEFGRPIPFGKESVVAAADPGLDLVLTLDSYLQFVAEQALQEQVSKFHALDGTAIVMNPWTGEVLAMANAPDFDPNHFSSFDDSHRRDRAVMDAYEPGSTFKLLTVAAGLESGKISASSRFPARDAIQVGGRTIHNAEDGFMANQGGSETVEQIVQYSHNVGAAEIGLSLGPKIFYDMERRAGFGAPTEIGLPGENPGIVPAPAEWSDSSLATMSFGQGVSVTPLAMARFYCAIANGGVSMRPRILRAVQSPDGHTIYSYGPEVERRIFSERTAATLRGFLHKVVLAGTGDPTAQIAGYSTAGKTGTAQMVVDGAYRAGSYAASFIGMVPYEHPRYVIYVKVERPLGSYYGSLVAAPAFAKIARAAMLHDGVLPQFTPAPRNPSATR